MRNKENKDRTPRDPIARLSSADLSTTSTTCKAMIYRLHLGKEKLAATAP